MDKLIHGLDESKFEIIDLPCCEAGDVSWDVTDCPVLARLPEDVISCLHLEAGSLILRKGDSFRIWFSRESLSIPLVQVLDRHGHEILVVTLNEAYFLRG
jgi:hypothetical protein